ncbi:MAG TPA: hypothetical protein VNU72_04880, partial [Puia sp.]|nr:hypothetical protein [Puia sp.]
MQKFHILVHSRIATVLFIVAGLLFGAQRSLAQTDTAKKAVTWDFSTQQGNDGKPILILHAHILDGWRLYSTTMPDTLPNSRVALDTATKSAISGIEELGTALDQKEPLFGNAKTKSFTGDARWLIHLQSPGNSAKDLKGTVTFMAINKDSVIGPLEVPFRYRHVAGGGLVVKAAGLQESTNAGNDLKRTSIDLIHPVNNCGGTGAEGNKGLLGIFLLGFLGGLIGLIMPCTFPMIPLTVSFFTKKSGTRQKGVFNAFLYGFFIFLIYTLISTPFYFLKANNANILNNISTNIWLNLAFSAVFFVFALS